jgi:hypothetical protein
MIYESTPWKRELRRSAIMLSVWCKKPPTERGYFLIEKQTFLSAFVVRKLFDSHKITDAIRSQSVALEFFPAKLNVLGGMASAFGKSYLDEVYDVETSETRSLTVREIVNQIIHSFFFVVDSKGTDETFLFFNSDRTKGNFVVQLPLSRYVQLLRSIVADRVQSASILVDRLTGKVSITLK